MQLALEDLKSERLELVGSGVSFEIAKRCFRLDCNCGRGLLFACHRHPPLQLGLDCPSRSRSVTAANIVSGTVTLQLPGVEDPS